MTRPRSLFLALTIPDDLYAEDPDDVADAIALMLNEHRQTRAHAKAILDGTYDIETGGPHVERIMVNGIPAPQWLSRETLDRLRRAASAPDEANDGEEIDTDDSWYAPLQGPCVPDEVNEVEP